MTFTDSTGTVTVHRDCDGAGLSSGTKFCPDVEKQCDERSKSLKLKACAGACCKTDNCNNFTPSSAAGIMVTKFTLVLMVIAGLAAC